MMQLVHRQGGAVGGADDQPDLAGGIHLGGEIAGRVENARALGRFIDRRQTSFTDAERIAEDAGGVDDMVGQDVAFARAVAQQHLEWVGGPARADEVGASQSCPADDQGACVVTNVQLRQCGQRAQVVGVVVAPGLASVGVDETLRCAQGLDTQR